MASAMDFLPAFLSGMDKKALRGVSRRAAENPLTLQEQLLLMTRRANAEQLERAALQLQLAAALRFTDELRAQADDSDSDDVSCTFCGRRVGSLYRLVDDRVVCTVCYDSDPTLPAVRSYF